MSSSEEFKTPCKPRRPVAPRTDISAEASKPWTAARCQRLLRPLFSRLASLRRDAAALALQTPFEAAEKSWQETSARAEEEQQQSPSKQWLKPRKRVRLTYSQRRPTQQGGDEQSASTTAKDSKGLGTANGLRQNEKSRMPGELVAATPLLRRARGHVVPSPISSRKRPAQESEEPRAASRQDSRSKTELARKKYMDQAWAGLRPPLSFSDRRRDLQAICGSLETLLKATQSSTKQGRGPRSLLEMCLRKVPQYIEELEAWERMEAAENGTVSTIDDVDTSAHIYNYLESFAPTESLGWRHLRAVVRADGVKAVKDGILEGLIGDDYSELLINACIGNRASPEAEELITALVDRQYSQLGAPDSFSNDSSLRCLAVLRIYANRHDRALFLLRQYSRLLSGGILPQDWLGTEEFEQIWRFATRCLSKAEAADDAIAFTSCSISLLCRQKQSLTSGSEPPRSEKNMQTLTSVLTILATMSWLGEIELCSESVSEAEVTKICFIGNRLRYILSSCMVDLESTTFTRCNLGKDLLRMALFLSSSSARGDTDIRFRLKNSIEQAWRQNTDKNSTRNGRSRHRLSDIASLVSSVARSCGRGMSLASHNCLDTIFVQLECLELDPRVLASLKAVAAFSLAQQTNNVKDFIYAERLASSQSSTAGSGALSRPMFTGYRWEETIGEWVTASPVVERRRPQTRAGKRGSTTRSEVDHGEDNAAYVPTQPGGSTDGDADNVPGLEIERSQNFCTGQAPSALRPRHVNNKKRSHSDLGDSKPRAVVGVATSRTDRDVAPQPTKSADPSLDDELGSDKENQDRPVAKKPRRSIDRRSTWSSKPRSSLASQGSGSMLGDDDSEDELCM
ncbi:hypothetical protein Hte_002826 [Hypoxylon texense]